MNAAIDTAAAPAGAAPISRELPFEFRGSGSEYFRIWIVNLLLTILTLGIYSAWAKVRRLRYFYGNTLLDGSSFEYHGRPIAILKGRLIAVAVYLLFIGLGYVAPVAQLLLVPLLLLGVPWVIVRARIFHMRMTSWRGIRFNFVGTWAGALVAHIIWPILGVLTLTALMPYALWKQVGYHVNNTRFGSTPFSFTGRVGPFYAFFYGAVGLVFVAGILAAVGMGIAFAVAGGEAFLEQMQASQTAATPQEALLALLSWPYLFIFLCYVSVFAVVGGYYRSRLLNNTFGNTEIGSQKLDSRLRARNLIWIFGSNIVLMIFTLGLFYPWARIRSAKYQFDSMSVDTVGSLDTFVEEADTRTSATGEELGEFFDVDFGF